MEILDRVLSANSEEEKSTEYYSAFHRRMLTYGNILVFAGVTSVAISAVFADTLGDKLFVQLSSLSGLIVLSSVRYYNKARKVEEKL